MKIFKLIIAACLVLSIFAMLVACGDGNTDVADSSDTAEESTADVDESVSEETTEAPESSVKDNDDSDDIIYDNF